MNYPISRIKQNKWNKYDHNIRQRHTMCNFVGNDLLKRIIEEGPQDLRKIAVQNLEVSNGLRNVRKTRAGMYAMFISSGSEKRREIYDMKHSFNTDDLAGYGPILTENDKNPLPNDEEANKALDGSGHTFDFYKEIFHRTSIDNNGMILISSVRFGENYGNAFWTNKYMVYGEGGDGFFKRGRMTDLSVCAHELTHGVTDYEANLNYSDEAGGLNEGMSDIFGCMCEQWVNKETVNDAHWLIGKDILENGAALRSMKEPGKAHSLDNQIAHYDDFNSSQDPHISSGIANRAFYLTCMELGGHSWEKTGKIWYIALKDALSENSTFQDAANATFTIAGQFYGTESKEQKGVYKGWDGVGVSPQPVTIDNQIKTSRRRELASKV
jgi:Zn-dependent metalloprotease